jgi:hypothetical protein
MAVNLDPARFSLRPAEILWLTFDNGTVDLAGGAASLRTDEQREFGPVNSLLPNIHAVRGY